MGKIKSPSVYILLSKISLSPRDSCEVKRGLLVTNEDTRSSKRVVSIRVSSPPRSAEISHPCDRLSLARLLYFRWLPSSLWLTLFWIFTFVTSTAITMLTWGYTNTSKKVDQKTAVTRLLPTGFLHDISLTVDISRASTAKEGVFYFATPGGIFTRRTVNQAILKPKDGKFY